MKTVFILTFALLSFAAGCGRDGGPPLAPVTGKVTLYGKPYPNAIVSFTPEGGGPAATSSTDQNGDYELWSAGKRGAAIGKHKVSVTTIKEPVKATTSFSDIRSDDPKYAAELAAGGAAAYKVKEEKEKIPAKYNKETELSMEVNSGTNKIDLDLK